MQYPEQRTGGLLIPGTQPILAMSNHNTSGLREGGDRKQEKLLQQKNEGMIN